MNNGEERGEEGDSEEGVILQVFPHSLPWFLPAMGDLEPVKILVLGDSGTGKSSLVHLLCEGSVLAQSEYTVGCDVSLKAHDVGGRSYAVEFWDVGGNASHEPSRSVFYRGINGVMLFYDMANMKSWRNLRGWLRELAAVDRTQREDGIATGIVGAPSGDTSCGVGGYDGAWSSRKRNTAHRDDGASGGGAKGGASGGAAGGNSSTLASRVPIILIGNKQDRVSGDSAKRGQWQRAKEFTGISTIETSALRNDMDCEDKLRPFLDAVVRQRYSSSSAPSSSSSSFSSSSGIYSGSTSSIGSGTSSIHAGLSSGHTSAGMSQQGFDSLRGGGGIGGGMGGDGRGIHGGGRSWNRGTGGMGMGSGVGTGVGGHGSSLPRPHG